ncbi:MAG TPA: glycosyltransferase family 4 protein [Acidimicrobiales bacterium]|nr:glycosyltransferase family 4 protein [Acidimicrobiales bacterium]
MRTLVVTQYFPPEVGAPQARLSELARLWSEAGDDVTVLTGMPNHPTGIVPPSYRRRLRVIEHVDGYRVVRTWLYATPNDGVLRKTVGHLSFMVSSAVLGGRAVGPADVVVVSSPTFFSIFSAWALARAKNARFVVEVRDLWPAIFVELGVLREGLVLRVLEALERAAYRAADAVVVVTNGFRDHVVGRGIPPDKVHTVPNGADLAFFSSPVVAKTTSDISTVLYLGAHGISHGLDSVVDAAAKLQGEPIEFVLVGEGATKAAVAERVERIGLANVRMLPAVPRREVPALLAAADICLVPLRDVPLFETFIPSKMFEYLAAGRPVVGAVRGEAARILVAAGAVVVDPEDAGAIADAIRALAADRARREEMGRQGREYVTAHYDRRRLAARYRELLGALAPR